MALDNIIISQDDVHQIVNVLMEDSELVRSKQKFYNGLGLPHGHLFDIERRALYSGSEAYEFFRLTLLNWISLSSQNATLPNLIAVLNDEQFISTADKFLSWTLSAKHDYPENHMKGWLSPGMTFDLTKLHPRTQEGELVTDRIRYLFQRSSTVVVIGPDGFGKRTTALWYAYVNSHMYEHVIEFNIEDLYKLEESVINVARTLQISPLSIFNSSNPQAKPLGFLLEEVFVKLKEKACLFIFKNVADQHEVRPFLPQDRGAKFHSLLLSTNEHEWPNFPALHLKLFSPEEAVQHLCNRLKVNEEDVEERELLKQLSARVCYLPLALEQIINFAETSDVKLNLRQLCGKIENSDRPSAEITKKLPWYAEPIYDVFDLHLNSIQVHMPAAERICLIILHVMSFLDSDYIPREAFTDSVEFWNCLELITTMGLIEKIQGTYNTNCFFRIHPVWQTILQIRSKYLDNTTRVNIIKLAVNAAITLKCKYSNWDFIRFGENVWEFGAVESSVLFDSSEIRDLLIRNKCFLPLYCMHIGLQCDRFWYSY